MITVVTTYNLEIFKMFYEHKHHSFLKENLLLYVDQDDSSEFRKIVDPKHTKVFDKNDFRKYYGSKYLPELTTFSKIYFLNMLLKENIIGDSFYFTDDDVLFLDDSFKDVALSKKAVYANDMILIIDRVYPNWNKLYKYIQENFNPTNSLSTCATNFYFPKELIASLRIEFNKVFDEYIQILYDDQEYIRQINEKSRSTRNAAFAVFYLDTPFFNIVYPRIGIENYERKQIYLTAYSHFRRIKDKLNTSDTGKILKTYISKGKSYPNKQPLYHFSVNNKLPLMRDMFNCMNERPYVCSNIDDILKENPREEKKLNKVKSTSLF